MKINFKVLNTILVLLFGQLLLLAHSWAQDFSPGQLKTALVGQFIKHIEWPALEQNSPLVVIVLRDRLMWQELKALDGEQIAGKRVAVRYSNNLDDLRNAHLVYLPESASDNVDNTLALMRGNGTLVVTENSDTRHNIMINITDNVATSEERYFLSFEINRPNILFEKLTINPELILFGGTELDVASLYRETETAMQNLRSENAQALHELEIKRQEVIAQQNELQNMQNASLELTQQLRASQQDLEAKQQELVQATQRLEKLDTDYNRAREESAEELKQANLEVRKQISVLADLKRQIEERNELLRERESAIEAKNLELNQASEKLLAKTDEVELQAAVIDKQFLIIIGIVATLLVFAVGILVVIKMFFKNRTITRRLESTLETLKNAQQQLVESEKLASLGQMVTGVAHEINTPIGVVITSSSKIGDDAQQLHTKLHSNSIKKSEMERFLSMLVETDKLIQSNLARCSNLIQNFKQVSADQVVAENRDIYLRDYIEDVMSTLSVVMRRSGVQWSVSGDNPPKNLDPGLLSQVINNLVNNAIKHAFTDIEQPHISIAVTQTAAADRLEFADNGVGMDTSTRKRIFDPFFTTKRGEGGTGLGMNIVYNLVTSKLKGTVTVDSEPGAGTRITIDLPR
ncbi:YfiR/HmsC family protein [Planctobacterium marinum]|uniref:histidine kinase n=1 Tax=Planctobacterium marinum TaxID=1631968 RepID=A0AA48I3Q3_9ALTE|nr:hypothetical protein MACH26_08610 [Planctobacterium marinum]